MVGFLTNHDSKNYERFAVVDLDPFGSPSAYIDCLLRAVNKGGMVSVTATDTAVLCGVHPQVCRRKYYGKPLNNNYARETALRLIVSLTALIASKTRPCCASDIRPCQSSLFESVPFGIS